MYAVVIHDSEGLGRRGEGQAGVYGATAGACWEGRWRVDLCLKGILHVVGRLSEATGVAVADVLMLLKVKMLLDGYTWSRTTAQISTDILVVVMAITQGLGSGHWAVL